MIPSLEYLDRYRNEGTRTYSEHSEYTEAEERFRPDSPHPTFDIPAFHLSRDTVNIHMADPDPTLEDIYLQNDQVLFCVHPQLLNQRDSDEYLTHVRETSSSEGLIQVCPSSSTRTLYVQNAVPNHALKVHFPFQISRYGRRMRAEVVEQAVNISRELQGEISHMPPGFAYLREVLGISLRNLHPETPRGENWGYLVREMTPFPHAAEAVPLVPGFSLYGRDFFSPGEDPLLYDMVKVGDQRDFILDQIMFPIIGHWVGCFLRFGFLLEPHGQNVLFEVDPGMNISRIVYRDLNLGIDNRRRRDLNIPITGENTYNRMEGGEFGSITYDKFMGGHFFDRLVIAAIDRDSSLDPEDFRDPCRKEFARLFPEHQRYLPRTVQYFSEERDQFGKPLYKDTETSPSWRP